MRWKCIEKNDSVVVFSDGRYRLRVEAYAKNIMRVTQTDHEEFLLLSEPMISLAPMNAPLAFSEKESGFHLENAFLACRLNAETGRLVWFGEGTEIMREPEKDGRILRKTDVVKYAFSADDPVTEYISVDGMRSRVEGRAYVDRKGYQTKLSFAFDADEAIYGLGQHEESLLNYRGQHQFLYQNNLKISCPVLFSTNGWALLNNCTSAQIFHDDAFGSFLSADCADEMDYFVMYGPEFDALTASLRLLTGDAPMLPRWALGYVQSKERYKTQDELIEIADEYRRRGIPIDCIVQDWCTWPEGQWGQKTPDPERYPDLAGTIRKLHEKKLKLMWSVWPNMNGDSPNKREFLEKGLMLGNRSTYNAFDDEARKLYWKQCNEQLFSGGMDAWWCDCTEPFESDWYGEEKPFPEDRMFMNVQEFKHYIDPAKILAYSIYHSRALYEGQRGVTDEKRVVNLTRSGLTGQQRYATVCWNGDTAATWEVLRKTVPDGLNFSITGIPYWTVDAGAFFVGKKDRWFWKGEYQEGCRDENYRELYVRWLQLGAFLPMMRSHGTDTPREIWQFGEPGEMYYDAIEKTIRLRYRLMPYLYSEMANVHFEKGTLLRMLAFDFRKDQTARNIPDQFMFGHSLMVCPILAPAENGAAVRKVYLPEGADWYDFYTDVRYRGGEWIDVRAEIDRIPLFVRAGSILPIGPDCSYADEKYGSGITLKVYSGANGKFTLYNDAGDGYGYEKGEFMKMHYAWNDAEKKLTAKAEGDERFVIREPEIRIL